MKKLFISQPMNGKTDDEILKERSIAIEEAKEILGGEIEVIDTFYTDFTPDAKPLEYLSRSIKDLASADIAYFVDGWQEKRGCVIEHKCAISYGIPTIAREERYNFENYGEINKEYSKEELSDIYKQIILDIEKDIFDENKSVIAVPLPFKIGDRVKDLCDDIYIVTGFSITENGLSMSCYPEGTDKELTEEYGLHWRNFIKI